MKLYGLLVAQNESDVIEDTLDYLQRLNVYEAILFFDLGSVDDTFEKALKFKDILYRPQKLNVLYTEKLRYDLLEEHRSLYREGDWISLVDADEFYVDNPVEFIHQAEEENANCIQTYQIQFMYTDLDLRDSKNEDCTLPIYERRKHYLINWSEERFYKYLPDAFFSRSKLFSKRLLNRHYQYRTSEQMQIRIKTRLENKKKTQSFRR